MFSTSHPDTASPQTPRFLNFKLQTVYKLYSRNSIAEKPQTVYKQYSRKASLRTWWKMLLHSWRNWSSTPAECKDGKTACWVPAVRAGWGLPAQPGQIWSSSANCTIAPVNLGMKDCTQRERQAPGQFRNDTIVFRNDSSLSNSYREMAAVPCLCGCKSWFPAVVHNAQDFHAQRHSYTHTDILRGLHMAEKQQESLYRFIW